MGARRSPSIGGLSVRAMTPSDLRFSAALHQRSLPHGFFVELGEGYLRLYHRSFVVSPYAPALVAEAGGRPIGFLVGVLDAARHRHFAVRRMGLVLAARATAAMLVRPRVAAWFVRHRLCLYARRLVAALTGGGVVKPAKAPSGRAAVVMHVATDEEARGLGAGKALLEAFTAAAEQAGATRLELVTRTGEDGAGAFYERLGWTPTGVRRDRGETEFELYVLELR
ncbi:MAG: GNAT family N-acetyltransferase [Acidimicrobiales bacterium]